MNPIKKQGEFAKIELKGELRPKESYEPTIVSAFLFLHTHNISTVEHGTCDDEQGLSLHLRGREDGGFCLKLPTHPQPLQPGLDIKGHDVEMLAVWGYLIKQGEHRTTKSRSHRTLESRN